MVFHHCIPSNNLKQPRTCLSDKPWWNTVAGEGVGQNQVSKYRLIREVSIPTSACCSLMVEQPSCSQVAHCTIFSNDSLSDASGDTSVWRTLPGRKESLDPQDPVSKCRLRKKGIAAIPSTRTEIFYTFIFGVRFMVPGQGTGTEPLMSDKCTASSCASSSGSKS